MKIMADLGFRWFVASSTAIALVGCAPPAPLTQVQLESLGVRPGTQYWDAMSKLQSKGYVCSVSGAKRENFDCSKSVGFFPTCLLRVEFIAAGDNSISSIDVSPARCIGTP